MKIIAPWTTEEVESLNHYQQTSMMHPFTCGENHEKESVLVATEDGWICPVVGCYFTQDWCWDYMLSVGKQESAS